ncbi:MAG: hypothetical protein ACP5QO_01245 [Clostridia bacterium]
MHHHTHLFYRVDVCSRFPHGQPTIRLVCGHDEKRAGIANPVAFTQGWNQPKTAVADGNKGKVAAFGAYPLNVYSCRKKDPIANARAFVQNYSLIMTSKVKAAILDQRVNQLLLNDQGVMVGSGEVWLSQSGSRACMSTSRRFSKAGLRTA